MGLSRMINKILRRPLPNGTPRDRTSPQLRELHMIQGNVLAQILLDMFTTMSTILRLRGPKPLSAVFAHLIREIRRVVTQSLPKHTLAVQPPRPALYSPVLPRTSRPGEDQLSAHLVSRPGNVHSPRIRAQPRTTTRQGGNGGFGGIVFKPY